MLSKMLHDPFLILLIAAFVVVAGFYLARKLKG